MKRPWRKDDEDEKKQPDRGRGAGDDWRARRGGASDDDDDLDYYKRLGANRGARGTDRPAGKDDDDKDTGGGRSWLPFGRGGDKDDKKDNKPARPTGRFGENDSRTRRGSRGRDASSRDKDSGSGPSWLNRARGDADANKPARRDDKDKDSGGGRGWLNLGRGGDDDKPTPKDNKDKDSGSGRGWLPFGRGGDKDDDKKDDKSARSKPFVGGTDRARGSRGRGDDANPSPRRPIGAEDNRGSSRRASNRPSYLDRTRDQNTPGSRASNRPGGTGSGGTDAGGNRPSYPDRTRDRDQNRTSNRPGGTGSGGTDTSGNRPSYLDRTRDQNTPGSRASNRPSYLDRTRDQNRPGGATSPGGTDAGSNRPSYLDRTRDQNRPGGATSPGGTDAGSNRPSYLDRTRDRDQDRLPRKSGGAMPPRSESQSSRFGARSSGTQKVIGVGDKDKPDEKKDEKRDSKRGSFFRRSKKADDKPEQKPATKPDQGRDNRPGGFGSRSSASGTTRTGAPSPTSTTGRGSRGRSTATGAAAGAAGAASSRASQRSRGAAKPDDKPAAKPSRGKSRSKAASSRTQAASKPLPRKKEATALSMHQGLDLDRKIDLVGVTLVAFALVMFFSVIPSISFGLLPQPDSGLTYALNDILSQLFGWGKLALPVAAFSVGLWLMRESFAEDGIELDYFRIIGMLILFTGALAWLHMLELFNNVQPSVEVFRPYSRELAIDKGGGGGWIGHQIYIFLLSQLLDFGTISVLVAWIVVGMMLTFDLSVVEIWAYVTGLTGMFSFIRFTRGDRAQRRAARRMLKVDSAPVMRPGEDPQQLALEQATAGAALSAATGTPKTVPGHATVESGDIAETIPERPAPRINRRGPGSEASTDAESEAASAAGEPTRDASSGPSRRRMPHLRRAGGEPGAEETAAENAQAGAASTDEGDDSARKGRFGFLRRGKSPDAGDTNETSEDAPTEARESTEPAEQKSRGLLGMLPFGRRGDDSDDTGDDTGDDSGAGAEAQNAGKPGIPVPPRPNAAGTAERSAGEPPTAAKNADKTGTGQDAEEDAEEAKGGFFSRFRRSRPRPEQEPEEKQNAKQDTKQPGSSPETQVASLAGGRSTAPADAKPPATEGERPGPGGMTLPPRRSASEIAEDARARAEERAAARARERDQARDQERAPERAQAQDQPRLREDRRPQERDQQDGSPAPRADANTPPQDRPRRVPTLGDPLDAPRRDTPEQAPDRSEKPANAAPDRAARTGDSGEDGARHERRGPNLGGIAAAGAAGAASAALFNRREQQRPVDDSARDTARDTARTPDEASGRVKRDGIDTPAERSVRPERPADQPAAKAPENAPDAAKQDKPAETQAAAPDVQSRAEALRRMREQGDAPVSTPPTGQAYETDRLARPARPDLVARRPEFERREPPQAQRQPPPRPEEQRDTARETAREIAREIARDDAKPDQAQEATQQASIPPRPRTDEPRQQNAPGQQADAKTNQPDTGATTAQEPQPAAKADAKNEVQAPAPESTKPEPAAQADEQATQPAAKADTVPTERAQPVIRRRSLEGRGPAAIPAGRAPESRQEEASAPRQSREQESAHSSTQSGERKPPERRVHAPARQTDGWEVPDFRKLLQKGDEQRINDEILIDKARVIEDTLASFGAPGKVVEVNPGPVITQFGVEPDYLIGRGGKKTRIKVNQIAKLDADLSLALAAKTIRIEAPVPGKGFVGIEVPNDEVSLVGLYDIMDSPEFRRIDSKLRIALGLAVDGSPVAADLTAMPHLLIAGTTGSGKSVCVNSIITSLLLHNTPDDLQFIMVDPKRVELTSYNGIPHLVAPVVVELERIVGVLQWVQREMEERYRKFASIAARNIIDYNRKVEDSDGKLPYYVVVVDELADLMMLAPDETERLLARLAQMARATGIHLIISTQRPSVDIITGLIKANFPARIAFAVASSVDSRVILDQPGAEKLLGRGDMLYQPPDAPAPLRMQGVFVSDKEINAITRYWKGMMIEQADTESERETLASPSQDVKFNRLAGQRDASAAAPSRRSSKPAQRALWGEEGDSNGSGSDDRDELYDEAVALVQKLNKASISLLQRRLRIGYTRAARLIDIMEQEGVVGPQQEGSKPREVIKRKIESGDD